MAVHRGQLSVWTQRGPGRVFLSGKLAEAEPQLRPAVGDLVRLDERGVAAEVLPRTSSFIRKAAGTTSQAQIVCANVDVVFVVTSLDRDLKLGKLDRYLTAVRAGGASAVILLNKTDLCADLPSALAIATAVAGDAPCVPICALDATGLEPIRAHLGPDRIGALVGSSGAGKSTILNQLLGEQRQLTHEIRGSDGRGMHTTTHRELFRLPDSSMIIDTPGMRELGLWGAEEGLGDLDALADGCRFRDCTHMAEPGCAIGQAVHEGVITTDRLASWRKLQREVAHEARRARLRSRVPTKKRRRKKPKHRSKAYDDAG